jgi:hypothetical protein
VNPFLGEPFAEVSSASPGDVDAAVNAAAAAWESGFQRASAFGIAPPDGIPDDAWMAVTLSSYSPALRGKVIWPPAFSGVT